MKKNKSLLFITIVIVIASIITGIIYFLRKKQDVSYFAFFDIAAFQNKNNKWSVVPIDDIQVFSNKFNVLIDNEYVGKYELRYFDNKWYFFDDDMNSESFSGDLFAYYSKEDINVADIEINELDSNDLTYVNKVLKKKGFSLSSLNGLVVSEKVSFDVDGDGEEETIYAVSNADIMENQQNSFSTVFYVKKDKVHSLKLDIFNNNDQLYNLYTINNLFKIGDNDKYYLSTYRYTDMSSENQEISVYKLNSFNNYKLAISSDNKVIDKKKKSEKTKTYIIILIILAIGAIGVLIYKKINQNDID